jgi:hypothetical protein
MLPTNFGPFSESSSKNTDKSVNQNKKIKHYGIIINEKMDIYKFKIYRCKIIFKKAKI